MCTAETYDDIHAVNHEERTNQMLKDNVSEALAIERQHVFGVGHSSIYEDFPFFDIPKQLPQCSRSNFSMKITQIVIPESLPC